MRVLLTTAGFPPAYLGGGPIRTISAMLSAAPASHETFVLTSNHDLGRLERLVEENSTWRRVGTARVLYADRGPAAWIRAVRRGLREDPDVVYVNSLFSPQFSLATIALVRLSRYRPALVIAPRGELSPGALAIKSRKKATFLAMLRRTRAFSRVLWHASTPIEAGHIRDVFGPGARIIVREDDTGLPLRADRPGPVAREGRRPLNMVFMSRLARIKGLHVLLQALAAVDEAVDLCVVGPEEDPDYARECHDLASHLPAHIRVRFLGAVPHERIRATLGEFDVMALPTAGENFGHVIPEALSVGCPLILTDTTPWTPVIRSHGAGVILVNQEPSRWAAAIADYARRGSDGWSAKRQAAAGAYDAWRATQVQPHFFDMLDRALEDARAD